nr:alpha-N-acetylgalactosaminidase-like [Parasteatoda tepidariorum]
MILTFCFVACILPLATLALDNGLARTPPMGWLSWTRFACQIDCENDPKNCISEQLIKDMANRMAADGFKDVGYEYVNIDDCWLEKQRDANGKLVADRKRFPSGIKGLADYVHSKGLKLGIYQDVGTSTCAGYPGSYGHFDVDAATFAEWGVDMLKVDGCYADAKEMDETYPQYSIAINKTGRPILFSCEWPFYQTAKGMKPNFTQIAKYCNIWRNYDDVNDSWQSVLSILNFFIKNQDEHAAIAGPGQFNDPDMLLIGNFGLSYDEEVAQLMLWSVMASPLIMSNDLRDIRQESSDLLKNKEILAVNQDPLGKMGKQVSKSGNIEIWTRPITPVIGNDKYSYAIVFFSRNTLGGPTKVTTKLSAIGLNYEQCYTTYDVFDPSKQTKLCPNDSLTVHVNPSGATMIIAKCNSS